jgi:pimeloyl-ACP methyl ester carboxylesterase
MFAKLFGTGHHLPTQLTSARPVTLMYTLSHARWHTDMRDSRVLLLLHNAGGCNEWWSAFNSSVSLLPATGLTPSHPLRVYAPDLRNHGASPHTDSFSFWDCVADVHGFADSVVVPKPPAGVDIIGHGLGGRIGAALALATNGDLHAMKINSVTCIDAAPPGEVMPPPAHIIDLALGFQLPATLQEAEVALAKILPNEAERAMLTTAIGEDYGTKKLRWKVNWESLRNAGMGGGPFEWPKELNELSCDVPTLFVGDGTAEASKDVKRMFRKASFITLPNAASRNPVLEKSSQEMVGQVLSFTNMLSEVQQAEQ